MWNIYHYDTGVSADVRFYALFKWRNFIILFIINDRLERWSCGLVVSVWNKPVMYFKANGYGQWHLLNSDRKRIVWHRQSFLVMYIWVDIYCFGLWSFPSFN